MTGDDVRSILAVAQYSRNGSREENGVEGLVSMPHIMGVYFRLF